MTNRYLTKTCTDCGGLFALPLLGGLPIDSFGDFVCLDCAAESDTTGSVARDGSAWDGVIAVDGGTIEVGSDGSITARRPFRAVRWADLFEDSNRD